jgi:hypothetical protein
MKKLSEIDAVEEAKREKAWRFERLSGEVYRHERMITQLEAVTVDLSSLRKIHELAGDIPKEFTTKGSTFIAGGFIARDILMSVAGGVLADAARKQDAVKTSLVKERALLAKAKAALKAVEG